MNNNAYCSMVKLEEFYSRIDNDLFFALAKSYPQGNVLRADDILNIEEIGMMTDKALSNQKLKEVMEVLKDRSITAYLEREQQATQKEIDSQSKQADASQTINFLF